VQEDARRTSLRKAGTLCDPRKVTLREILDRYLREISPKHRGHEIERYQLAKVMRAPLSNLALSELSVSAIALYRDQRLKDVAAGTIVRELHLIQHALSIASREWGYALDENPVEHVAKPRLHNARNRRAAQGEIDRITQELNVVGRDDVIAVVRFALETAMRRGEILELQWRHVDVKRRTAHLPRTKNGHARTVPLTNGALALLGAQSKTGDRVFDLSSDALKMCWRRVIAKTGIEDLHFHDLRHEAISRFFEMGLSMPEVALISGHRDPRMLLRYTHLVPFKLAEKLALM